MFSVIVAVDKFMRNTLNIDSTSPYRVGQIITLGPNRMRYRIKAIIDHNTMTVEYDSSYYPIRAN